MSDIETGTEWSHLLGRGMAGKLEGERLKPVVCDMSTWQAWIAEHPESTVLDMPRSSKAYSSEFYSSPENFVFGFVLDGKPYAISLADLEVRPVQSFSIGKDSYVVTYDKEGTVARLFDASMGGKDLTFDFLADGRMKDQNTGSEWDLSTGVADAGPLKGNQLQQRVGIMSFRRAWKNFHPDTQPVSP